MKYSIVLTSALLGALVAVPPTPAAAPAFRYEAALSQAVASGLNAAAGEEGAIVKRVYVKCYRDRGAFERPLLPRFGVSPDEARFLTAYYVGGGEVHMRAGSCANAQLFAAGVVRWDTAAAFSVLLHEALHRQGIEDERATTCLANDAVRWAGKALGLSDLEADRARLLAFRYTAERVPAEYRMSRFTCLRLVVSEGLTWWQVALRPRLEKRFD